MADTPETPTTGETKPKAAPRRRAPRKATAGTKTGTGTSKAPAAKKPATATAAAPSTGTATARRKIAAAKPRAAARPAPKTARRPATAVAAATPETSEKSASNAAKPAGKWRPAAIAGGIAAIGATAAALLSLRGSTAKRPPKKAHQPDGGDSSKSFTAGIADENTIPDKQ